MHVFERMFRRAEVPFRSTQGFHPQPRIVFALSLALGIVGCEEVVEVELEQPLDPEELHQRLRQHCPPGLEFLSVQRIDRKARAQVTRVRYRVPLPPHHLAGRGTPDPDAAGLPHRIKELLDSAHCWVERQRPRPRRLDLRPYLHDLHLVGDHLEMDLWMTGAGTARPDEVLELLGLGDILEAGAILERTKLELRDEQAETEAGPPCPAPEAPQLAGKAPKEKGRHPAPLLPGPMSFDS
jgi:radical SAM-linked protein